MKNIFKLSTIIMLINWLSGCSPIDITDRYELSSQNSELVVEGYVTNIPKLNYVKITQSRGFRSDVSEIVPTANVSVSDNRGNTYVLTYAGNGLYKNENLLGIPDGRMYTLEVNYQGKIYTANGALPTPLFPIDSISFQKIEQEQGVPAEDVGKYRAKLYTKIRTDVPEYYFFNFYRNDSLINERRFVYFSDNVLLSGNIPGIELPGIFQAGDTAAYEIMSINYDAYKFYSDLNAQLTSDGGLFSAPPANVKGNVNGALGLFKTAYVLSGFRVIPE